MIIKGQKNKRYLLPVFYVCKTTNPLTKDAKILFNSNWVSYWTLGIGWLWWEHEFILKIKIN